MILKLVICLAMPLLMLLGFLEKRSRNIVMAVLFGSIMCIAASYLNNYAFAAFKLSYFYLTTTFAPMSEELLKFIPVVVCAIITKGSKEKLVPFAFAVGVGFALVENSYMLMQNSGTVTIAWLIIRGVGAGLMHSITTVMSGYGLSFSLSDKRTVFVGTVSSLFLAIMYHGAYNCLIQTESVKYFGILLPILTYGAILLLYHKKAIQNFLTEK